MADCVSAYLVASPSTDLHFDVIPERGVAVLGIGNRHGSEIRVHLRAAEIDRLAGVLAEARQALRQQPGVLAA